MLPLFGLLVLAQAADLSVDVGNLQVSDLGARVVVKVTSYVARPIVLLGVSCAFTDSDGAVIATADGAIAYLRPGQTGYTIIGLKTPARMPTSVKCRCG